MSTEMNLKDINNLNYKIFGINALDLVSDGLFEEILKIKTEEDIKKEKEIIEKIIKPTKEIGKNKI